METSQNFVALALACCLSVSLGCQQQPQQDHPVVIVCSLLPLYPHLLSTIPLIPSHLFPRSSAALRS